MKYKILVGNHGEEVVESETLLNALNEQSVFKIVKSEDDFFLIEESCDNYFSVRLTREQLIDLADEIRRLATGAKE